MKRYITLIFCTVMAGGLGAQSLDGVAISGVAIEEAGSRVNVAFTAEIAEKSVRGDYALVFAPVLTDGNYKVSMPPVVVQGRRARKSAARYEWIVGEGFAYQGAIYAPMGTTVSYSALVDGQPWMRGADLILESVVGGCCSYTEQEPLTLAENIDVVCGARFAEAAAGTDNDPSPAPVSVAETCADAFAPRTLADTLSRGFPFVTHVSELDPTQPFRIYEDEREKALTVYYSIGASRIDKTFSDNEQVLFNLTEVIKMIDNDPASTVKTVVVAGFASPEGKYELNDRLAFERAVSVKEHIMKTTGIPDRKILVYNGSVDWRGLRYLVAKSDLPEKNEVLNIIDNMPVWDSRAQRGRHGELMKLNGGTTYRRLLRDFFPLLRNGAFIKVYYDNHE